MFVIREKLYVHPVLLATSSDFFFVQELIVYGFLRIIFVQLLSENTGNL